MNCVDGLIERWESNGSLSPSDVRALIDHLRICSRCRQRYAGLLPFLRRDAGVSAGDLLPDVEVPVGLADAVMRRVGGRAPRRSRRLVAYAAAAVLLIGLSSVLVTRIGGRTEERVIVRFELSAPEARSVSLVGDFVEWRPDRLPLEDSDGDGVWEIEVKLVRGMSYTYNFIIDGETWITDPTSFLRVKDGFGGESSVVNL